MTNGLVVVVYGIVGFAAGSLPFALWIGRWLLGVDVRRIGDMNPGATNILRAGSRTGGVAVLFLDIAKGALPVSVAHLVAGICGWSLIPAALAPALGHAFSPFLGFKGGKAVAVALGIWIGLTLWELPTVGGVLLLCWVAVVTVDSWAVLLTLFSMLGYLIWVPGDLFGFAGRPHLFPDLLGVWAGMTALLAWTHRRDLAQLPRLRPWIRQWPA